MFSDYTHTLDVVYDVDTLGVDADKDWNVLMSDKRRESSYRLLHLALEKRTSVHTKHKVRREPIKEPNLSIRHSNLKPNKEYIGSKGWGSCC